jgi:hypothetical protein
MFVCSLIALKRTNKFAPALTDKEEILQGSELLKSVMSLSPSEGDCQSPETKHESSGLLDYVCL